MEPTKSPPSIELFWDKAAPRYTTVLEPYICHIAVELALHAAVTTSKAVLEVGCGSGIGSLLIRQLLPAGAVYCCSDISKEMLEIMQKRYEASDFRCNPKNSTEFSFVESKEKLDLQSLSKGSEGIAVKVVKANNEALPFVDNVFNAYIAAASLHIVENPGQMLKECYRVLKSGGTATFSILGKMEESTLFGTYIGILEKYGAKTIPEKPYFAMGKDEPALSKLFHDIGFTNLKMWHQKTVFPLTGSQYSETFALPIEKGLTGFPEEVRSQAKAEFVQTVLHRFGKDKELLALDFIMIVCAKP